MKTIKLFFSTLLVVIISAIGMASCNDDDELKDNFRYVTTTMNKGEQLTYVLILANANKKGIQRLELTLERK